MLNKCQQLLEAYAAAGFDIDERGSGSRLCRTKRRIAYLQHDLNRDFYADMDQTEKDVHHTVKNWDYKTAKKTFGRMRRDLADATVGGDVSKLPTSDKHRIERVDETSMNKLASAAAKVIALRTQNSATNIAWAHTGLENRDSQYLSNVTYQNNHDRNDAEGKRAVLQKFLADRKTNKDYAMRSLTTNSIKNPSYGKIKKIASNIQNGDKDAVRYTKDGRTVNNSTGYWDYRQNVNAMGKEMDSIVDRVRDRKC
jgi:hypothetical protein